MRTLREREMRSRYGRSLSPASQLIPMTNPRSKTDLTPPDRPEAIPGPEIVAVSSRRVKCDGGGGALGHPVVFYEIGEKDFVECGYCDRRFVLDGGDRH